MVRFFLFEMFHGKREIASSRIRGHNLIKYWNEADIYKYGENPDVLIFQKVYVTYDYKFPLNFKGIKILDVCDPDWKDSPDVFINETVNAMDAIVTPTQPLADFLSQLTDKPVRVIKDRFDMSEFPKPKVHHGEAKKLVWFGYSHNAELLKFAMPSIEARNLDLLVVSNEDPAIWRWATKPDDYHKKYKWIKYIHPEAYKEIQRGDICIFPEGNRPFDKFKSENKSVIAELLGIPVVRNSDELNEMMSSVNRNKYIESVYNKLRDEYNVERSVAEYKDLISEIEQRG